MVEYDVDARTGQGSPGGQAMGEPAVTPLAGGPSRRGLICGVALAGIAVPLLAACGSEGEGATPGAGSPGSGIGSPSGPAGATTVAASDVPVGGGAILPEEKIVVTQPKPGEFKAFSAVCTHQGCTVQDVSDGQINCPCHGSAFSVADGSVVNGPAKLPLPALTVEVDGDQLSVT